MNEDELTALLADVESDRSERTTSATDTDKFGEAICAFANDLPNHRKPGYLLALHELFVNAVVHRSYESTAPVLISEFTDRLEIRSPGGLYGIAPEEFPEMTGYRNPILAEAARVYGFANRFGRGIGRAQSVLRANSSPEATFDVRHGHVNVVVRRRP